ncbi:MAG: alpha/beta hydrolase [Gammaproteobacteria bacterium]|nr:alpha/beta hydrolase [Gammaproteobacteria bacterium]
MREITLQTDHGTRIALAEFGPTAGFPVVFCHGAPGSRLEATPLAQVCSSHGLRLICPNRPGYGGSDLNPGAGLDDWAADICDVWSQLGISRFSVLGFSGGAPFAMALAHLAGDAVLHLGLVSPLWTWESCAGDLRPETRMLWQLGHDDPVTCRQQLQSMASTGDQLADWLMNYYGESERKIYEKEPYRSAFVDNCREVMQQGYDGVLNDMRLHVEPWPFDPGSVNTPTTCWHGRDDGVIPVATSERVKASLPHCDVKVLPGQGHAFWLTGFASMLDTLVPSV